jgi:branched-subunit amino acid transport protein AzlD
MKTPLELLAFILVLAAATMATRFLPFLLPARWLDNRWIRTLKTGLPAVILLLLVVYSLKDTPVSLAPWGLPEALSLALVVGLHLWRRNALVSIAGGTALYMVLVQTGVLKVVAGAVLGAG